MRKNKFSVKGFTLLELLVALGILAIMVGVAVFSFPGAQSGARDTRRKGDIKQYQTSMEAYANTHNGFYPSYNGAQTINAALCTLLGLSVCIQDPKPPSVYVYFSNGTGGGSASATAFTIYVTLEKVYAGVNNYWVVCSTGVSGRIPTSSWTPSSTCPNGLIQ